VIANEVEKRLVTDECSGRLEGVPVTKWLLLRDQFQPRGHSPGGRTKSLFRPRPHDNRDLVSAGHGGLLDNDLDGRFGATIAVDQPLQRQLLVVASGGGDHSTTEFHGDYPAATIRLLKRIAADDRKASLHSRDRGILSSAKG
jgi:hypothetical protein